MITLKRYKQNLKVIDNKVYSYDTLVAKINGNTIKKVNWKVWIKGDILDKEITTSPTTSKHINYVAKELNLKLI
jgi:hypothetical protein|tara:strand:+ start:3127 stop:3348 length:222 start_codon:yes stop_codon:yes gene_type:complete